MDYDAEIFRGNVRHARWKWSRSAIGAELPHLIGKALNFIEGCAGNGENRRD